MNPRYRLWGCCAIAGLGLTSLLSLTTIGGAYASSSSPPGVSSTSGGFLTQSAALKSGQLLSITDTPLSDGGKQYTYRLRSGSSLIFSIPPRGFSPLMASDAQLQEYGFPAKPTTASGLSTWHAAMAAWRASSMPDLVFSTTPIAPSTGTSSARTTPTAVPINGSNGYWSGYDVNATTQAWAGAQGEFGVPGIGTACGQSSVMSIWTGVGGVNSPQLIQSGLAFNENIPGQVSLWTPFSEVLNDANNNPPYELYGAYNVAIAVNSGDLVISNTEYYTSTGNASYYLEDLTSGQTASYTQTGLSPYYDGSTAEWISEFPTSAGAQFTSFAFVNTAALNNNGYYYNFTDAGYESFYVSGREHPGSIGSNGNSFAEFYDGC